MKYQDCQRMSKKINNNKVPVLRFPEFNHDGQWDYLNGDVMFDQISDKDHNSDLPILAITQEHGAIPRHKINYNVSVTDKSVESYKVVNVDDFIISLRSFQGGIEYSNYKGICSPAYIVLRKKKEIINLFFKYYFKTSIFIKDLNKNIEGIRDGKMVSYKQFSELLLPRPPRPEQQKIADCLSSLDELITAQNQKLEALKSHKKGLMQQLFPGESETVPKLRFKEYRSSGAWTLRKFGEFIAERSEFPLKEVPLYSLTIEDGVTPKTERYERSFLVKNEDDAYKLVYPNDFAYNPMNLRFGAIARHRGNDKVALSKYYNIFHCDNSVDSRFCEKYFRSHGMIAHYDNIATGSLVEKRRVHFSDFLKLSNLFPELSEQKKIADCLSSLDDLIEKEAQKLDRLNTHKEGLLQQMFPSKNEDDK
ncbi:restriction endonuclease subunit S [Pinibacter soli]|uniref:Restriction endonuclease subunit S n=1 Tax=Pinibacter soli TaxID=3044211 RepID=A0ABT6RHD4_9BACT|nr:restriction endonuclease subunit S [Pinibacter soli]MDI3321980.1 restriction endonuclease subunit S [Pinibacter soli]